MIKLMPIDISKIDENEHPDLRANTYYLARIRGAWYAGTFTKQWYGWNFNAVNPAGYQLSYGNWEQLYEIVDSEVAFDSAVWDVLHDKMLKCQL